MNKSIYNNLLFYNIIIIIYFINFKSKLYLDRDGFLKITSKCKVNISKLKFDFVLNNNESSFFSSKYQKKIILSK